MAPSTVEKSYQFHHYCCAVIDLLGQSNRLEDLNRLPTDDLEREAFTESARATVGGVLGVRKQIENFYLALLARAIPEWLGSLTVEQQKKFKRLRDVSLAIQQFSDTIIFYAPVRNTHGDVSVLGVHAILMAHAAAIVGSLAMGIPLRAGIDVAVGVELGHADLYGPALSHAHELEQKFAHHPRIVVGNGLMHFLKTLVHSRSDSDQSRFNAELAQRCLNFLTPDTDGRIIIDYLGTVFLQELGDSAYLKLVKLAYRFVKGEFEKFSKSGDTKLSTRYSEIVKYFDSRISWLK